jgi:hypothetical protein
MYTNIYHHTYSFYDRDPLYVSVTTDGYKFNQTHVVASCEMDVFKSPRSGFDPSSNAQYTQAHLQYFHDHHRQQFKEEQEGDDVSLQGEKWGCMYRYNGGAKEGGCQYPQGIVVKEAAANNATGFWAIFSVNKEDIWIAKVPLTF